MANYSIHIKNFSKSFGDNKAVDDLSFDVNDGEIFAFLGANGSGKTTTIRCLLKIYQEDEGSLTINDTPYSEEMSHLIGYLPEERGLYKDTPALDLLTYTGTLRGMSEKDAIAKSKEYLERVGLLEHSGKKIAQLSSGMQQKVQLGVTLIHKPEILILDEPFKGLDPVNRQLFVDMFIERAEEGATILYSTHVIDEAQKMADRLLIIKDGKKLEYGTIEEVRKKHGKDVLHVEFSGEKPRSGKIFSCKITNNTAEIIPEKGVQTNSIIDELIKSGTQILRMEIDYPSLNEVFIKANKDE